MMIDYHCHQQLKIINVIWAAFPPSVPAFFCQGFSQCKKRAPLKSGCRFNIKTLFCHHLEPITNHNNIKHK